MPTNVTPGTPDPALQLEIARIDSAIALHPELLATLSSASAIPEVSVPPAAPVDASAPPAAPVDASAPPAAPVDASAPPAAPVDASAPPAAPVDVNVQPAAPVDLKGLLSNLSTSADATMDFSALNSYLADHATLTHSLVAMIDQFNANANPPPPSVVPDVTNVPADVPPPDTPVSLVGVADLSLSF